MISSLTLPYVSDLDQIREMHFRTRQGLTTEQTERFLNAVEESYRSGWAERTFFERVSGFDRAQSNVIREFLEYFREAHAEAYQDRTPAIAIERHWYHFAERSAARGEGAGP